METVAPAAPEPEAGEPGPDTYTVDELAQASGIPSRTIRFYQAEGILPWPEKQGRIAVYGPAHLERLQAIAVMQARGLQIHAIRELLTLDEPERLSVWQWLGLYDEALSPSNDERVELSEDELFERLGPRHSELVPALEGIGLVERLPTGRFRLPLPQLLEISLEFHDAGVSVDTSGELANILMTHLTRATEEILTYAQAHIGDTFPSSSDPSDLVRILEAVDRRAIEAVGILWADVMRHSIQEFRASLEDVYGIPDTTA